MASSNFTVTAILAANAAAFKAGVAQAKSALQNLEGTGKNLDSLGRTFSTLGQGMTKAFTLPAITGLAGIIKGYAGLEQAVGGVETLFKGSSKQVIKNAEKAYRTAGISGTEYMEQVTSFSARLLQGLGGDTKKAARYADKAILDMSDNANKFGTNIGEIQRAYQGFAKNNFTMLDNLKLGRKTVAEYKPNENGETLGKIA